MAALLSAPHRGHQGRPPLLALQVHIDLVSSLQQPLKGRVGTEIGVAFGAEEHQRRPPLRVDLYTNDHVSYGLYRVWPI